jgi:hypothetical protein
MGSNLVLLCTELLSKSISGAITFSWSIEMEGLRSVQNYSKVSFSPTSY